MSDRRSDRPHHLTPARRGLRMPLGSNRPGGRRPPSTTSATVETRSAGADSAVPAVAAAGVPGIRALIGVPLGPTAWTGITSERAAAFAYATGDHQCP
ncbi:hypothetical protein ACIHDR_38900 [Nocardia sp. NPDC052278]|uniref:hypothetical protein n=1 Tax=unclassified Nocardia TaxID=2637762 RepID=UPI00367D3830